MDQVSLKYTIISHCKTKFTQIWILGLKTNYLATLDYSDKKLTVGECRTLPSLRFAFVGNVFRQNGLAVVQPADGADGEAVSAAKDADVIADVHATAARIDLDRHRGCKKMIELCRFVHTVIIRKKPF
jgi:hypothetical protein